MKSGIYDAVTGLNHGFEVIIESLKTLQAEGVIGVEYVHQQTERAEELRAAINSLIHNKLQIRELDDLDHYGKMVRATEARLKSNEPAVL